MMRVLIFLCLIVVGAASATPYVGEEILKLKREERKLKSELKEKFKTVKEVTPHLNRALKDFERCKKITGNIEYCRDKSFNDIGEQIVRLYQDLETSEEIVKRLLEIQEKTMPKDASSGVNNFREAVHYGQLLKNSFLTFRKLLPPDERAKISRNLGKLYRELKMRRRSSFLHHEDQIYKLLDLYITIRVFKLSLKGIIQKLLFYELQSPGLSVPDLPDSLEELDLQLDQIFKVTRTKEEYYEENVESSNFNELQAE